MDNTHLLAIALPLALILIVWKIRRIYSYWELRGVPTIPFSMPLGHFAKVGLTTSHSEVMRDIYAQLKGQGKFAGAYSFNRPIAVITDLELMRRVLINDFDTFHDRGTYHNRKSDPLSVSMISIEGEEWRTFRKKFATIFTSGKMKQMYESVCTVADELVRTVDTLAQQNDGVVEMKGLLSSYTTDAIGVCAFGLDCNSLHDSDGEFRQMAARVFEKPRNSPVYQLFISSYPSLAKWLGCRINSEEVEEFYMTIIKKTVDYRKKNNVRRNDLLDTLIDMEHNGVPLSIEQITSEAFAFFLAGFGTTSTMMAFALYELALNTKLQQKLRDEINAVLEQNENRLSYESLVEMTYLNQVFDESMRKYPPFGSLLRITMKDYPVPGTNQIIEKGTSVWIPILGMHHDAEYFPDPDRFDPERFSSAAKRERIPSTYMPFGDGPRNCIGVRFGMMKARIAFVKLMTNFEFNVCPQTNIPCEIGRKTFMYTVQGGVTLSIKRLESVRDIKYEK